MKGLIQCHSEQSRYDSAMNVKTLCERAKELDYKAVTLTDHGTLTGIDDFVAAAKVAGIKPIPGVELYVIDENAPIKKRYHLILLAVDDLGYQGISKIVSFSNKKIDLDGFPTVCKEDLKNFFGTDSKYHGHVIATSACVGGVLAGIYISPFDSFKEIKKLEKMQSKYSSPMKGSYEKNHDAYEKNEQEIKKYVGIKDHLQLLAKKAYKKKEKDVEKLKAANPDLYEEAYMQLQKEKEESEKAKVYLVEIREKISLMKKYNTQIKAKMIDEKESNEKWIEYQKKIDAIKKATPKKEMLYDIAKKEAIYYENVFGKNNFFIELQYHGFIGSDGVTDIEKWAMPNLVRIAKETKIPMVAANDAHMATNSENDVRARQIIRSVPLAKKKMVSEIREGDRELYLKTEDELRFVLREIADEDTINEAILNTYSICDRCNCSFNYGTHYPKYPYLKEGETSDVALRKMATNGIKERYKNPDNWDKVRQERFEYELSVISKMGYSDYFLIVQDFLAFGRKLGHLSEENLDYLKDNIKSLTLSELIEYVDSHQTEVGLSVGPGRGSAAGCLIAYLIGITDIIDPLQYDLLFERFLNEDRVTMPDVDSDFSPDIRDLVVEYCKKLYGVETVANIVTKGVMAPRSAVRNTARVIGLEKERSDYYLSLADKIAKLIPMEVGTNFASCEAELNAEFADNEDDSYEIREIKKDAREIIEQAKLVEGVFINYGMHAAGVIIADGNPIDEYVPLMKDDKSGDMKVQCNMSQAEEIHGLLKFDFLGLRNLKIITLAIRSIKKRYGIEIDVKALPFEKEVFDNIFSTGKTGSVFQFESAGMKKMLKNFRPDSFEDLIALVSLYRPGPMDFIPQYINSKFHPETITYLCPELKPILEKTYGCIVYQEQVMEIVQKLAGFSLSQADNVRRYMSKKKMDKLSHEKDAFVYGDPERNIDGCVKRGIDESVSVELFNTMIDFAKYAFNKSHAAAYALVSYITAYLKFHYPSDYMCAVLMCTDDIKKIPSVLNDCREMGIHILPPSINKSEMNFTVVDDSILFGLKSIKNTRSAYIRKIIDSRENYGNFRSVKDFLKRDLVDKSTAEGLIAAGAFDEFNKNRYAILKTYETASEIVKKIATKLEDRKKLEEEEEEKKETKRYKNAILKNTQDLQILTEQFELLRIPDGPEDKKQKMLKEKEILGFFVSSHPLDEYRKPEDLGCTPINDLSSDIKTTTVLGLVENYEVKKRKSDGKPMAFFDLEDKTGIIHVCCFTKTYDEYLELLGEDEILKIYGNVNVETDELSGESQIQIFAKEISKIEPDLKEICLKIDSMADWKETLESLQKNGLITSSGHPLCLFDSLYNEFRKTKFYVSGSIKKNDAYKIM